VKKDQQPGEGTVLDEQLFKPRSTGGIVPHDTKIFLRVATGPDAGRVFDISRGGSFILGRGKADIVFSDPKVSSRHAELKIFGPGHYYVWDLASTNGTFLNGVRIDRRKFDHEDEIRMGDTVLNVSIHEGTIPLTAGSELQ
jgi:pSer/pThr/pTyr-binding forkhead associated (FHA) protein